MPELSSEEIRVLARIEGLEVADDDLSDVRLSLNALIGAIEVIDLPGLNDVEPLPIILPREEA